MPSDMLLFTVAHMQCKKNHPYLHSRKEDEIDYVDFGSEFMLTTFTSN